jgi:Ser/Thr protein kinase RdoA (MazF antagonist)
MVIRVLARMSEHLLDPAANEVFLCYPFGGPGTSLKALGNQGGFSGANLWRVDSPMGSFCLRAWPSSDPSPERLAWIHALMRSALDAGLHFVPSVLSTSNSATWVEHASRLWDVTAWMPGQADTPDAVSPARMQSACCALAQLHTVWAGSYSHVGPCPGVQRRLDSADDWLRRIQSGWRPHFDTPVARAVHPWAERAWDLVRAHVPDVPRALASWVERPLPLQPCLCDIWHDHVLFEGDSVIGLIDYGGVKVDHVAVDLARLLGSLASDNPSLRDAGLQAYRGIRPLSREEQSLVALLDQTGAVIALATWLKWLYIDGRSFEDIDSVARRLAELVERVEKWKKVVRSQ